MADSYLGATYSFYVGWMRYSGGSCRSWIAAAVYNDASDGFAEKFESLDDGDDDARIALEYIKKNANYFAFGETPSLALKDIEDQIAELRENL